MKYKFKGFQVPNYTMTPNDFFDVLLRDIDDVSELKVTLVAIRRTFGFHVSQAELSRNYLVLYTHLSMHSVQRGIKLALKRGTLVVSKRATNLKGAIYAVAMSDELRNLVEGQTMPLQRGSDSSSGGAASARPSLPPINKVHGNHNGKENGNRAHPPVRQNGRTRKREPHFQGPMFDKARLECESKPTVLSDREGETE